MNKRQRKKARTQEEIRALRSDMSALAIKVGSLASRLECLVAYNVIQEPYEQPTSLPAAGQNLIGERKSLSSSDPYDSAKLRLSCK